MTIRHHPSDETLQRFAAGMLSAGPALVVAVHVGGCAVCESRVADFECLGGEILENMPSAHLAVDALARLLDRLDAPATSAAEEPIAVPTHPDLGIELPAPLRHCQIGPWRWLGPRFHWSRITIPGSPDAKVMLLRGKAGLRLPAHGHIGTEFNQILSGSLSDDRGHYLPGDFDEADSDVDHQPVVGPESECICLAALDGDTRLHGLLGRILRPLVGF